MGCKYCGYCGAELMNGAYFCVKCGKNSGEEIPVQEQSNKLFIMTMAIINVAILNVMIALVIICLPPSSKRIGLDALEYADIDRAYVVSDISVSRTDQGNGFLADVQIEAVNKDNNDTNYIQLYLDYYRNGLSYDNSLSGEARSSIYPNHHPTESDFFPMPDILFEIKDSGEIVSSSATEEGITIDIDYEHISIEEKTAEVPLTIGVDNTNVRGEAVVTAQYIYEGDYTWSGENTVTVALEPKYTVTEELISEDIHNNTFLYQGYISEEIYGTHIESEGSSVRYDDLYRHAEVDTAFRWQNEDVRMTGNLLLFYDFREDHWEISGGQIDANSVNVEWLYGIDEELLAEQLPEIIRNHCDERDEISNIEIVNTDQQGGKTIVTVNYNSVQQPFLVKNVIELDYYATIFQGYQLGDVSEVGSDYDGINGEFDKEISVIYNTHLAGTTPNGMSQNGTATVHLHINENGVVHLTGQIGTIPLDNSGSIEYPTGVLSLVTSQKTINVNYTLVFNVDADLLYKITPSLTYFDGKLSGNIICNSVGIGVDDFSIEIQ